MADRNAIVVTGTPGVGKTTAAKRIAEKGDFKLIELNKIASKGGIAGKDPDRDSLIINPRKIRATLRKILGDKNETFIIEGHFGDLVPEKFVRLAIVLRIDPLMLGERLRNRGYSEEKVRENVEAELVDSCLISAVEAFGNDRVMEIDATDLDGDSLTDIVLSTINGKAGMPAGSVNWMLKLEEEGKLQKLLR